MDVIILFPVYHALSRRLGIAFRIGGIGLYTLRCFYSIFVITFMSVLILTPASKSEIMALVVESVDFIVTLYPLLHFLLQLFNLKIISLCVNYATLFLVCFQCLLLIIMTNIVLLGGYLTELRWPFAIATVHWVFTIFLAIMANNVIFCTAFMFNLRGFFVNEEDVEGSGGAEEDDINATTVTQFFVRNFMDHLSLTSETVKEDATENAEEHVCSICLCAYEEKEEVRLLPCRHHFHKECIDTWFTSHNRCPLCRERPRRVRHNRRNNRNDNQ